MKILITIVLLLFSVVNCSRSVVKYTPEMEEKFKQVQNFPLIFNVPKVEEYDAWGRAQSFVGKYSPMKIQIVSDFIIDTYNPTEGRRGYNIVKTPVKDSIEFTVEVTLGKFADREIAINEAHACAYYIKTGNLYYIPKKPSNTNPLFIIGGIILSVPLIYMFITILRP